MDNKKSLFRNFGPGVLVAAAFIGPGTVTVCTLAGARFDYSLLWAMVLSIFATCVLQEMAARIGLVTRMDLAAIVRSEITSPLFRKGLTFLILSAIVLGNAAYESGNIQGAALGIEAITGSQNIKLYGLITGVLAICLLYLGSYKVLERILIGLVITMSVSFLLAAIITAPILPDLLKGLFIPRIPSGAALTVIALIGTTVVPYNLFLHSTLVSEKWGSASDLPYARRDTVIAIVLGGIISMAIISTAAGITTGDISTALDLAKGLEPLYGTFAKYFLGAGLFAAGLTSAITAPLAAAYVLRSCLGWNVGLKDWRFKLTWAAIICAGLLSLLSEVKPITIIEFAQVANGLLLPIITAILIWASNRRSTLGIHRNSFLQNIFSGLILLIATMLSIRILLTVFQIL